MNCRINSFRQTAVLATLLSLAGIPCFAADAADTPSSKDNEKLLEQIDFNHDHVLQKNEVLWGVLNRVKGGSIDFTLPLQPDITEEGILEILDPQSQIKFATLVADLAASVGHGSPYQFSEVAKLGNYFHLNPIKPISAPQARGSAANSPTASKPPAGRFYLRRSLDKVPSAGASDSLEKDAKSLASYTPDAALFSYGNARSAGHEIIATGVLAYSRPLPAVREGELISSFEFSRVNFVGKGPPATASPRFTAESSVANLGLAFNGYFKTVLPGDEVLGTTARLGAYLDSDWDFRSKILKTQVDVSFFRKRFALGVINTSNPNLAYEIDLTLHADYGRILATGPWLKTGKKGDSPAHAGPNVSLTLFPFPHSTFLAATPISIGLGYMDYLKLTSVSAHVRRSTAQLSWYVKKPGKTLADAGVAITIAYQDQKNVDNAKDDDSTILGLSFAY